MEAEVHPSGAWQPRRCEASRPGISSSRTESSLSVGHSVWPRRTRRVGMAEKRAGDITGLRCSADHADGSVDRVTASQRKPMTIVNDNAETFLNAFHVNLLISQSYAPMTTGSEHVRGHLPTGWSSSSPHRGIHAAAAGTTPATGLTPSACCPEPSSPGHRLGQRGIGDMTSGREETSETA